MKLTTTQMSILAAIATGRFVYGSIGSRYYMLEQDMRTFKTQLPVKSISFQKLIINKLVMVDPTYKHKDINFIFRYILTQKGSEVMRTVENPSYRSLIK